MCCESQPSHAHSTHIGCFSELTLKQTSAIMATNVQSSYQTILHSVFAASFHVATHRNRHNPILTYASRFFRISSVDDPYKVTAPPSNYPDNTQYGQGQYDYGVYQQQPAASTSSGGAHGLRDFSSPILQKMNSPFAWGIFWSIVAFLSLLVGVYKDGIACERARRLSDRFFPFEGPY